jgi:two-component system sensor histidine kinase HydH
MFSRDYRRERDYLQEVFRQRGEVLIHSLEMVGRMRFADNWEQSQILTFWSNLEENDNVLFLALTDENGRPLVVAGDIEPDASAFREPLPGPFSPSPFGAPAADSGPVSPRFRLARIEGRSVFMVYRTFWPLPPPRRMMREGRHHDATEEAGAAPRPDRGRDRLQRPAPERAAFPLRYLWVGFDMTRFEKLSAQRNRTAALFIGLFCLATLAGVLALFWGYNSRLARKLYQETKAMAAELIGRLPTGVILENSRGEVTLVNRSTCAISGLDEKNFLGRRLPELAGGLFPRDEAMNGREAELRFHGGNNVHVALTSGPVIGDDGRPLGQVILMEDLGEVGRLKAELAKKERLAALGGLAAGLAHEIRNPLGAISGLAQHLLRKGPADSGDREALEVMLASVDRLNAAVTDFLEYSKPAEIKPELMDLAELLRKMAALAGHDARSRAVDVALELPSEPVWIEGDESRLAQAFLNLYLNAIQAAGSGAGGRLSVSLTLEGDEAVLRFHDNGPGFSPEQLTQPFVPYFTTKAGGAGLGLALAEKTIHAHKGADISLAAPPEGGGLATIFFKRAVAPGEGRRSEATG